MKYYLTDSKQCAIAGQCRRQSKRSNGTLDESGGTLKYTELLHIKTDLQILCSYKLCKTLKILYLCLKKETYKAGSVSWVISSAAAAHNLLKNSSAAVNATRRATKTLLRGVNQKLFFFYTKNCLIFRYRAKQTDATQSHHRRAAWGELPTTEQFL